jgi:aminopeptidase N
VDRVGWRRVGTRLAAVATALMVAASAGCTRSGTPTPPVTPTTEAFEPGADGLGDDYYPTAGNGGYDVKSYDLDIAYDPETDVLDGIATITATASASLSSFNLDFVGLKTQSVTVDGADAEVDQNRGELVVTPAKGITNGTEFVTKVTYGGIPESYNEPSLGGPVGFLNTRDGAVAIGEPEVAASWFPVNDHPRDKATYTIKLTAPDALAAVSNGVLKEKKAAAKAGFTTWTWVESMPMAPYLATMVIGTYRVSEGTHDGLPVFTAVHTSLPSSVDATLARTPEVIDFLETAFGPYPFDAMGGIAINDNRIRFALENQTRPIYASAFFSGGGDASWVLAHELAHQWFGDSVSLEAWKEIWLNEGFASYAEWLWEEHLGGDTAQSSFEQSYQSVSSPLWQVPPGDPGKDDLFDRSVYTRGAMTLHALRVTVGDDAFFKILKTWAEEQKNGNATTEEFIALSEKLSGKELNELFDAWLYQKGRPPLPTP